MHYNEPEGDYFVLNIFKSLQIELFSDLKSCIYFLQISQRFEFFTEPETEIIL